MNIAFDSHKRYTLCSVASDDGRVLREARIDHERGAIRDFLLPYPDGQTVAVETIGNWYWIVDEIEAAGLQPLLVHARKAKMMMACVNKTDRLDVRGLNRLQQVGTLPTVWIPPGALRDERDLSRTRMCLVAQRTRLKNRLHASLAKYALSVPGVSDIFGKRSRDRLLGALAQLPSQTRYTTGLHLMAIDLFDGMIVDLDKRVEQLFDGSLILEWLKSIPGIGPVLSVVVSLEVGEIDRFASPQALASYAGTVPRVHASGGHVRYGKLRTDVNQYLKWAYSEAANSIVINRKVYPNRHVTVLYNRIRARKGHQKAIGAVARHMAEATYWILKKQQPYKDPSVRREVSTMV